METQNTEKTLTDFIEEISIYLSNKLIKREFEILKFESHTMYIIIDSFKLQIWIENNYSLKVWNSGNFIKPNFIMTDEQYNEFRRYIIEKHKQWIEDEKIKKQTEEQRKEYLKLKEIFEPQEPKTNP